MATLLVIIVILLGDSIAALIAGFVARARGRKFWLWALIGVFLPIVAIIVVLVLPRRRR